MKFALMIAACFLAGALAGCGATAGPVAKSAAPAVSTIPTPAAPTATPTLPAMTGTCKLGFDNGTGILLPLAAANWGQTSAEQVTLVNTSGTGQTLAGFATQVTYKGQLVDTQTVNSAPNLPEFLASGQSYTTVVDFDQLQNQVTATESVYLKSSCQVMNWTMQDGVGAPISAGP